MTKAGRVLNTIAAVTVAADRDMAKVNRATGLGTIAAAKATRAIGVAPTAGDSLVIAVAGKGVTGVTATVAESRAIGVTKGAGVLIGTVPLVTSSRVVGGIALRTRSLRGLETRMRNADAAWTSAASIAVAVRKTTGDPMIAFKRTSMIV